MIGSGYKIVHLTFSGHGDQVSDVAFALLGNRAHRFERWYIHSMGVVW